MSTRNPSIFPWRPSCRRGGSREFRRVRKQVFAWNEDAWETTSDTSFLYDGWNLTCGSSRQLDIPDLTFPHSLFGLSQPEDRNVSLREVLEKKP